MLEFFVLPCRPETPSRLRGYSVRAACYRNRDTSPDGDSRFPFEERKVFAVAVVAVMQVRRHLEWTGEARRGAEARK
jgi:hypothetical protein